MWRLAPVGALRSYRGCHLRAGSAEAGRRQLQQSLPRADRHERSNLLIRVVGAVKHHRVHGDLADLAWDRAMARLVRECDGHLRAGHTRTKLLYGDRQQVHWVERGRHDVQRGGSIARSRAEILVLEYEAGRVDGQ